MLNTLKKLLKIFIIVLMVVVLIMLCKESKKNEELDKKFEDQQKIIEQITTDKESIIQEKEELKGALGRITEEYEALKKEYETINNKYLEEIKPVTFNPNNLWEKSNATVNDMMVALKGTGLESLAAYYVEAEQIWGVNAIFLASLTAEESGWGTSSRAVYQNNLSGFAVYSDSAEGRTFASKKESIMETAKLICKEYLEPTGRYHSGISIESVNTRYCPGDDYRWANNIKSIAYSLVSKINNK